MDWGTEQPKWEMTVGRCRTDGAAGEPVYGIRVTAGAYVFTFEDVDASPQRVRRLLERLRRCCPEPVHLQDIVLDFINGGGE